MPPTDSKQPKVLVVVADGSEEIEAVVPIDILRRANISVTVAGLKSSQPVTCSRNVVLVPDLALSDINEEFDMIVLPGGLAGAEAFASSKELHSILKSFESKERYIAAICAAPIALLAAEIGKGSRLTSHPSVQNRLEKGRWDCLDYTYQDERVVKDGKLITSRGPGTAFEFAFMIVETLCGKDVLKQVVAPMMCS
ncbi:Dj-1 activation By catechol quinone modification [Phlyctochytrium arcticum]|nr:Dj-1 activation By catechol quinone modification [Phlyctochytrium arcticum]